VVHPLTNIADGTSATVLEDVSVASLLTGDFAVNAHNAQDSSVYTACGNVPDIDVNMVAGDNFFDVGEMVVQAGQTITLNLDNQGERNHNIFFHSLDELNAADERGDRLAGGQSRVRQFTFDHPGIYPFYCPVGSHEDSGMIGVLRVLGPVDGDPTLQLDAPSVTQELEGPEILFGASVTNFNIEEDDATAGLLKISLDGEDIGTSSSIVGALDNIASGEHTITAELVNADETPLATPVQSSLTFTVEAGSMPTGSPAFGTSPIDQARVEDLTQ
jgi:plastocyanin